MQHIVLVLRSIHWLGIRRLRGGGGGGGGRICLIGDLTKYTESGWVFWPDTISGRGRGCFGVLFQFAVIRFSPNTKSGEGGSASQQGGCGSQHPAYAN